MAESKHIFLTGTGTSIPFTSTSSGGSKREYAYPARDRVQHSNKLRAEIESVEQSAVQHANSSGAGITVSGISLECVGRLNDALETNSLDNRISKIELLSTRRVDGRDCATVFIPDGKLRNLLNTIDRYQHKNDLRSGEPRHRALVESIDEIRYPLVESFWTDSPDLYPTSEEEQTWFEVWLRDGEGEECSLDRFRVEAQRVGLIAQEAVVRFPGRLVLIVYGTVQQWSSSVLLLGDLAELRRAKQVPTDFVELPARELVDLVEDGGTRIRLTGDSAPAVCLLDTGVQAGHPLLSPLVPEGCTYAVEPDWSASDNDGHGTAMAGLTIFGDELEEHLMGDRLLEVPFVVESVKLIDPSAQHDPQNYGAKTEEAVAIAEAGAPERPRVICLAISADDRELGSPSSWSAALDQSAAGALDDGETRRLYLVAAGNVRDLPFLVDSYPSLNQIQRGIEDPGQSWNALTIGAITDRCLITHADFGNHGPVAPRGGLSPKSRTSMMWSAREWPVKPDLVFEGGNYAAESEGEVLDCDDLRILTASWSRTGAQLGTMADTSAATALAARLAARLSASYPTYWPETIRALLVHSAEWNDQMLSEFPNGRGSDLQSRLRCYGYGVPNERRAFWTAKNSVTLVAQERIVPFGKDGSRPVSKECHVHDLPWPTEVLESLGNEPVTVRVTLSYFIEPSPGRRGWTNKFRYASHGLRFSLRGDVESNTEFLKRITRNEWSDLEREQGAGNRPSTGEPQNWAIGNATRARGSVHSDWFTAPAVEVARAGKLAVYPVTGWWRERHHLGRIDSEARYALVVTISTSEVTADLLTPIEQSIAIATRARV